MQSDSLQVVPLCMQKTLRTEVTASNLPEVRIVAHVASAKIDGRPYALVGLAMGVASGGPALEGVLLHWACVAGQNQDWQQPPSGWHTDPDYSQGAGDRHTECVRMSEGTTARMLIGFGGWS